MSTSTADPPDAESRGLAAPASDRDFKPLPGNHPTLDSVAFDVEPPPHELWGIPRRIHFAPDQAIS
jgi:hypothetical protein